MKIVKALRFVALVVSAIVLVQCTDDKIRLTTPVKIRLTDAPAQYDQVNIDIQSIQYHASNDEMEESGWQEMELIKSGVYDLLQFNNYIDTLLVDQDLPSGTVSQMRFILGENNSVVVNNITYDLNTPSAQTSGIKFQIHDDFLAGIEYKLWIDFDAARSILKTANGDYKLHPLIRTYKEATTGAISGLIAPSEALPTIHAIRANDTISTIAETNGTFLLKGLEPGTYKLAIDPIDGYQKKEIEGISLTIRDTNNLNTINLEIASPNN